MTSAIESIYTARVLLGTCGRKIHAATEYAGGWVLLCNGRGPVRESLPSTYPVTCRLCDYVRRTGRPYMGPIISAMP